MFLDFETYSEAPIGDVGAPVYAAHPSTRVLCACYGTDDAIRLWMPGDPNPEELFQAPRILARNSMFEQLIWERVCTRLYGWPSLPLDRWECTASRARAWSIPASLERSGLALGASELKDTAGKRLIREHCMPRKPTIKDPRTHIPAGDALIAYCAQDIVTDRAQMRRVPSLSDFERRVWLKDQEINHRGVAIDLPAVENCIRIVDAATERYTREFVKLTKLQPTQLGKVREWLADRGCVLPDMQADTIANAPAPECEKAARALKIRQMLGSASVKKLYSMRARVDSDGRLRDLLKYCGADGTGRWSGMGPQPQNLPRPPDDWDTDTALSVIATGDDRYVEAVYGNSIEAVSNCLRGLFVGRDLICSDYTAIEAVVLAALAGEEWRLDVFRTHGKIYEASAAAIKGTSLEYYAQYKAEHGKHHPDRMTGKVAELACFAAETEVLTDRGYVAMVDVQLTDLLWDGEEWTTHKGVIPKGNRETLDVDGVKVTPYHPISLGHSWQEARLLASNENILFQALAFASASLPSSAIVPEAPIRRSSCSALAAPSLTLSRSRTYERVRLHGATSARNRHPLAGLRISGSTPTLSRMMRTGGGSSTDWRLVRIAAITRMTPGTRTTAPEESTYARNGSRTSAPSFDTLSLCRGGTTPPLSLTGATLTEATSPGTYGLSPEPRTPRTSAACPPCSGESPSLRPVYDIAHAGPRNRFTIRTASGHLIVHNSGFGGGLGAWLRFGAGATMTDEEIQAAIKQWRQASPAIVRLWYGLWDAACAAVRDPGREYSYRALSYQVTDNVLYCRLPSGRRLAYHAPELSPGMYGRDELSYMRTTPSGQWYREASWYGLTVENAVQAVARERLAQALVDLDMAVVLHIHDEIVVEGSGSVELLEETMARPLPWTEGWPIKAAGGWTGYRYRKA